MENNLINQLIFIAKLYYIDGLTQSEIAEKVHIHRSQISRMLKEARKLGLVKISVNSGLEDFSNLQNFLIEKFKLKEALIVPENINDLNLKTLGSFAANYLSQTITNNSVIGIA